MQTNIRTNVPIGTLNIQAFCHSTEQLEYSRTLMTRNLRFYGSENRMVTRGQDCHYAILCVSERGCPWNNQQLQLTRL